MTVGGRRAEPLARRAVILLVATLGGLLAAVMPSAGAAAAAGAPGSFDGPLRRALPTMVSESDAIDAIVALQAEVLLLVELDAFPTPVPSPLLAVHDASAPFLAGLDRPALRNWLRSSDQDGFASLQILTNAGVSLGDRTVAVLQPLSEDAWRALADGSRIGLPAVAYVAALDGLNAIAYAAAFDSGSGSGDPSSTTVAPTWTPNPNSEPTTVAPTIPVTAAPFVPVGTSPASPTTVSSGGPGPSATPAAVTTPASLPRASVVVSAPSTGGTAAQSPPGGAGAGDRTAGTAADRSSSAGERTATSTTDDATGTTPTAAADDTAPAAGSSTVRWLGAALAALAAAAAAAALLGARRRRRRAVTATDDADAMLEAGRRLSSTVEHGELLSIVLGQTRTLLAADRAAYLGRVDHALHVQAVDPADGAGAEHGSGLGAAASLVRVADTGQTWRGELPGPGGDQAAMAVAVTAAGQVQGVLIALRAAARPFGPTEQARIDRLAPLVGAALANASRHDALAALTLTDALTALANRRQLDRDLHTAANGGGNNGLIGFAMIDVDHFKSYNDTHGHPAGDALLRQLAEVLAANVRPGDVVYRYGGEEFAVLLPGADQAEAAEVAERVRRAVHDADLAGGDSQPNGRVTVSVGVAVGPSTGAEALKGHADRSLYEAKHGGRDRVVVAGPADPGDPAGPAGPAGPAATN